MFLPRLLRSAARLPFAIPLSLGHAPALPRLFPSSPLVQAPLALLHQRHPKAKGGKPGGKGKAAEVDDDENEGEDSETSAGSFDEQALEKQMSDCVDRFRKELGNMRFGRANPAILDPVIVKVGMSRTPLNDLAQLTIKDPQTLLVNVHDFKHVTDVEKAIREAGLNLNPVVTDKVLKVPIPKQTKEFRENLIKLAGKAAEHTKIGIRAARQDGMHNLKKDLKVQNLTDKYVKEVDDVLKTKSKELSS
ncbi:ribosome recycling factor domain-containing protein [Jimgerdemannia flammicorona]|uniref:Ribosome recycling factor domain-containing protein n=1 Tax=Jimgerdemannia flammicorona TaxID=994334 RepID=A0A433QEN0_9FUNG|nr:ribosome recycling factor domain-containing protein [Jimgerdemannia flammicorona]